MISLEEYKQEKKRMLQRFSKVVDGKTILCLILLLITACEQRDPQAEYELLRETVYSSPQDGEVAAQEYIDHFYKTKKARINEVSEIRHQYRMMDNFLSNSFSSYADFLNQSREINKELSHSNYAGVRKTWLSVYEKERDQLLGPLMDSITEDDFDSFFKTQVKQLCENEFNIWEVESIDQVSMSTPALVNDGTAKKSHAEYRVHLRGNIFGVVTKVAKISIDGIIGLDESGNINSIRTGYQFLEKPLL